MKRVYQLMSALYKNFIFHCNFTFINLNFKYIGLSGKFVPMLKEN